MTSFRNIDNLLGGPVCSVRSHSLDAWYACSQLDTFESIVDDLQPRGGTNIYDVIKEGCAMLKPVFVSDPNIDLRVLVLTDGESCGGMRAAAVLPYVNEIGAVVDAIIVGNSPDPNLVCEHAKFTNM